MYDISFQPLKFLPHILSQSLTSAAALKCSSWNMNHSKMKRSDRIFPVLLSKCQSGATSELKVGGKFVLIIFQAKPDLMSFDFSLVLV